MLTPRFIVAKHAETLLRTIDAHYLSSLEEYMKRRTRGDNTNPGSPWSEVRHALGRLLSYFFAIKVLISARKYWPRLFVDFTVTSIPSTPPSSAPDMRRNAKGIIQRMSRDKSTIEAYQDFARSLQGDYKLDDRIRQRVANFRPIVHAEVNLLASVLDSMATAEREDEDHIRFFNEAEFGQYIGSSKPTCLLCSLYFAAHPSPVQCRQTHGNLYYNWRAPDVFDENDQEAIQSRQDILEKMIKDVRNEAGRAIKQRSFRWKKHDSRDTPSNPLGNTTVTGWSVAGSASGSVRGDDGSEHGGLSGGGPAERDRDVVDLAAWVGQINVDVASNRAGSGRMRNARPVSRRLRKVLVEDDNDDDDPGGAIL